jgi:2-aminoadipate transaminase
MYRYKVSVLIMERRNDPMIDIVKLDKESDHPLYLQLYNQLQEMIEKRQVLPDSKLPPIRKLATKLGVNNVTIVNAYKLLEYNGLVYSKVGSGTYVADLTSKAIIRKDNAMESARIEEMGSMDRGQIEIGQNTINFASATPTPELFPVNDFKNVLNEVLDRDKGFAFGYQESQGFYPLRESIASYLSIPKSKLASEDIQIISGAQQGIDILAKVLLNYGDYLIVESPTYTGAIAAFRSRGANIIEVPMENDGINLEILEDKIKKYKPKFIYCMPNFQNPTGYCYSYAKKRALLELVNRYDVLIIEDDYLTELNYGKRELTPLKLMDRYDKVAYIKSFSKIFMPGLRLAFLSVPQELYSDVLAAKHISDISTSAIAAKNLWFVIACFLSATLTFTKV